MQRGDAPASVSGRIFGMENLRVAAVSMNSELGRPDETWARIEAYCDRAAAAGADLILLPELVVHGHCAPDTWEIAEAVPEGPAVRRLECLAKSNGIFVSAGLSEKQDDVVFNTQVLVGPGGYFGKQRKLHTSRDETFFYKGGWEASVFDIGKARVGIAICYDNELPEVPRLLALRGAEVILMPHAGRACQWNDTPQSQSAARHRVFDNYASSYRARAKENACFCVVTDQAGRAGTVSSLPPEHENQPHHPGGAMIIAPNGEILAHAQLDLVQDETVLHTLDRDLLAKARSHPNYTLRTRRPELFGDLARSHLVH